MPPKEGDGLSRFASVWVGLSRLESVWVGGGLGRLIVVAHLGMCRAATSGANLRKPREEFQKRYVVSGSLSLTRFIFESIC